MVAAEHIDDVPQLFNFIEVSRHVPLCARVPWGWLPLGCLCFRQLSPRFVPLPWRPQGV